MFSVLQILQILIDRGCTCLVADENLKTPLHFAAEYGKLKNVEILFQASIPLYVRRDEMGRLALHYAAMNGRRLVVITETWVLMWLCSSFFILKSRQMPLLFFAALQSSLSTRIQMFA